MVTFIVCKNNKIYNQNEDKKGGRIGMRNICSKKISIVIFIIIIMLLILLCMIKEESGAILKSIQGEKMQIEEMKEQLISVIAELQTENGENVTLDDITQDYLSEKLSDYEVVVIEDLTINIKKVEIKKDSETNIFIIDKGLNVIEEDDKLKFSYELGSLDEDNKISILIRVQNSEEGLEKIEFLDEDAILAKGVKREIGIDYQVEMDKAYKVVLTTKEGKGKIEKILIKRSEIYIWEKYNVKSNLVDVEKTQSGVTLKWIPGYFLGTITR